MTVPLRPAAPPEDTSEYRYLERRPASWRRQLYIRGRNMTVDHLVRGMLTNGLTPEGAAADYELSLEQIQEALLYYERHRDLIEQDWQEEREYLGTARGT